MLLLFDIIIVEQNKELKFNFIYKKKSVAFEPSAYSLLMRSNAVNSYDSFEEKQIEREFTQSHTYIFHIWNSK